MAKKKKKPASKKAPIQKKSTQKGKKIEKSRGNTVKTSKTVKTKTKFSKKSPEKSSPRSRASQKDLQKLFEADFAKLAKVPAPKKAAPAKKPTKAPKTAPEKREPVRTTKGAKKPLKAVKAPKEAEKKPKPKVRESYKFNSDKPLLGIDLEKARKGTVKKNKQKIYRKRSQLKKKLENVQNEKERENIINELYRTSRWLQKANEKLGRKVKKSGFKEKFIRKGPKVAQRNVYLWEADKALDSLIDSGQFKTFIINGKRMRADQVLEIMEEFGDLEELGSFTNDYFVEIEQNSNTGTVTINLPTPQEPDEDNE